MSNETKKKNSGACWGAKAIGEALGKSPRATYHMLENGLLNDVCQKIGNQWVGDWKRIRRLVFGEDRNV